MQNIVLTPIPIPELVDLIASEVESRLKETKPVEPLHDRIGLEEVIRITGLQKSALYKKTMDNAIPHCKFGRQLVFSRREVEAWMQERTVPQQSVEEIAIRNLAKVANKKMKRL